MRIVRRNSNRYQACLPAAALLAALGFVAAGCGGSASASSLPRSGVAGAQHSISSAAVQTRKIKGLGVVLVNSKGRTLYVFTKDAHRRVTCTGKCASFWPPLKWMGSARPKAGGAAKSSLLAADKDPAGGKVVTYNHWPLYTFLNDKAGQARGWNLNLNGGKWYVISATGKVVKHKTSSGGGGGGGGTTTGSSWG